MNRSISSNIYNTAYYEAHSKGLDRMFKRILPHIGPVRGLKVLDLGCGSGDLSIFLAKNGASVVGIDYSKDAIQLAKQNLEFQKTEVQNNVKFYKKDARFIKFKKNTFDMIVSIDLFEHIHGDQLESVVEKATKVLKPGGILVVHTEPNKVYLNFTHPYYIYPISQLLIIVNKLVFRKDYPGLPKDPRNKYHKEQHVNEPTLFYLKDLFKRHGYKGKIISIGLEKLPLSWKDRLYNAIVLWSPLSKKFPLNLLFAYDYICVMGKNK